MSCTEAADGIDEEGRLLLEIGVVIVDASSPHIDNNSAQQPSLLDGGEEQQHDTLSPCVQNGQWRVVKGEFIVLLTTPL